MKKRIVVLSTCLAASLALAGCAAESRINVVESAVENETTDNPSINADEETGTAYLAKITDIDGTTVTAMAAEIGDMEDKDQGMPGQPGQENDAEKEKDEMPAPDETGKMPGEDGQTLEHEMQPIEEGQEPKDHKGGPKGPMDAPGQEESKQNQDEKEDRPLMDNADPDDGQGKEMPDKDSAERPDGQTQKPQDGERTEGPDGSRGPAPHGQMDKFEGDDITFTITGSTVITDQNGNSITLADITEDTIIKVVINNDKAVSITAFNARNEEGPKREDKAFGRDERKDFKDFKEDQNSEAEDNGTTDQKNPDMRQNNLSRIPRTHGGDSPYEMPDDPDMGVEPITDQRNK